MTRTHSASIAALAFALASLPAQYGFRANTTGSSSQLVSGCGFDCSDPNNVIALTVVGGDLLNYEVQGDPGMLAGVLISLQQNIGACPGIVFPGIANSLLLNPAPTVTGVGAIVSSLPASTVAGSCGAFGRQRILAQLPLPAFLAGLTISFQGLVHDGGMPTLTRALDITVM